MSDGSPVIECEETPYLMRVAAIRKTANPETSYVRVRPNGLLRSIATFRPVRTNLACSRRGIRSTTTAATRSISTLIPNQPLDAEAIYANWGHRAAPPDYKTPHNLANMHLQDRERMKQGNFSGISGAAIQDRVVQESMGPIGSHKEHLGTSDKAVIFYRRLLLGKLQEMDEGKPIPGLDPALSFDQRACSFEMPSSAAWQDVVRWQENFEGGNPARAAE